MQVATDYDGLELEKILQEEDLEQEVKDERASPTKFQFLDELKQVDPLSVRVFFDK